MSKERVGSKAREAQYAKKISSPETWRRNAIGLLRTAELVEPEVRRILKARSAEIESFHEDTTDSYVFRAYFLLIAYALENLFKGELVKRLVRGLPNQRLEVSSLPNVLISHQLDDLAEQVGLSLTEADGQFLKHLSKLSIWAGRYPAPTKAKGFCPIMEMDGDLDRAKALVAKIRNKRWRQLYQVPGFKG